MPPNPTTGRPEPSLGSVVGETILGAGLVAIGLWFVYLALGTHLVASLATLGRPASPQPAPAILAWAAALAAPAVLVLLGTDRLARIAASIRTGSWRRRIDPFVLLPVDVKVVRDAVLDDGREVPTILVGPFGLALVHALDDRHHDADADEVGGRADPREMATRDAERMRRWLVQHDQDFVVRIYAAIMTRDGVLPRTSSCAVIRTEQLPAWVASLPRQRSLSEDRRARIVALLGGR